MPKTMAKRCNHCKKGIQVLRYCRSQGVQRCLYRVIFRAILVEIAFDDFLTQRPLQIFHIASFKCNHKQMLVCRNGLLINSNTVHFSVIPTKILNVQYIECL
ncbi:unnamed protein product [Schistosoma mattheei]|uniref:Uncharacterized protein n=1 Tax=Schistosoma mattheei TaxID=31246 RepID=A0AA85B496_9TREM|nr:unnamed protein product [Schistosoma mattheei]